jgi:hypothetical protein
MFSWLIRTACNFDTHYGLSFDTLLIFSQQKQNCLCRCPSLLSFGICSVDIARLEVTFSFSIYHYSKLVRTYQTNSLQSCKRYLSFKYIENDREKYLQYLHFDEEWGLSHNDNLANFDIDFSNEVEKKILKIWKIFINIFITLYCLCFYISTQFA